MSPITPSWHQYIYMALTKINFMFKKKYIFLVILIVGVFFLVQTNEFICVVLGGIYEERWEIMECPPGRVCDPQYSTYYQCDLLDYKKYMGCARAGEQIGTMGGIDTKSCCIGLNRIEFAEEREDSDFWVREDTIICSDCGNGICEKWENKNNCPVDCKNNQLNS